MALADIANANKIVYMIDDVLIEYYIYSTRSARHYISRLLDLIANVTSCFSFSFDIMWLFVSHQFYMALLCSLNALYLMFQSSPLDF